MPARDIDARLLAIKMRPADAAEGEALGFSGQEGRYRALREAIEVSRDPRTVFLGRHLVCMYGVKPLTALGGGGMPWIMTTDQVERHPAAFLRGTRRWIEQARQEWSLLANCVDARHVKAIQWLRWLGFTIHPATPTGPYGLPFHLFELRS